VRCGYGPEAEWGDFQKQLACEITDAIQAASNEQLERCRAHDRQRDVARFMRKFGQHEEPRPGFPPQDVLDMRVRLIAEEFCEFLHACGYGFYVSIDRNAQPSVFCRAQDGEPRNLPAAADGLIDMEYVILGTHVAMGIDSNPLWAAVQAANMSKEGGATREDGKIMKPEGFQPPDIAACLRCQGWRDGSERDE
jgi:predicted HAD superfamily Cof-like phosphohydrolase